MTSLHIAPPSRTRLVAGGRRRLVGAALGTAALAATVAVAPAAGAAVPGRGSARPAATCGAGHISLSRTSGGNGALVTVKGTGWWAPVPGDGLGGVTVSFTRLVGPQNPGATVVNSHGAFSVTLRVSKADARGHNPIKAIEESGCTSPISYPKATAAFTVS